MKKYIIFVLLLSLIILPSCKKKDEEIDFSKQIYAEIIINKEKKIHLALDMNNAPITVKNFVKLVQDKFYDGTIIHRIEKDFCIQGGGYYLEDNYVKEKKSLTDPIKGEFSENGVDNKLSHDVGVISMARTSVNDSATSQFFLCSGYKSKSLDGKYAAFRILGRSSCGICLYK